MRSKSALSMVEILVAVAIISLAVGPLIGLLSSSSRMSNASIHEEMAVHYAREIADQLLTLSPKLASVVDDAQTATGDASLNLASILNDSGFRDQMEAYADDTGAVPLQVGGQTLPVRLVLSPLNRAFTKRRVTLSELDTSSNQLLKADRFWEAKIELSWKDPNSGLADDRQIVLIVVIKEG